MFKRNYTISKVQSINPILSGGHTPAHNTTMPMATGPFSSQQTEKAQDSPRQLNEHSSLTNNNTRLIVAKSTKVQQPKISATKSPIKIRRIRSNIRLPLLKLEPPRAVFKNEHPGFTSISNTLPKPQYKSNKTLSLEVTPIKNKDVTADR